MSFGLYECSVLLFFMYNVTLFPHVVNYSAFRKNMEIPILKSSARISSRLNYVCPQLFPSSGFWSGEQIDNIPVEESEYSEVCLSCSKHSFVRV